MNFMFHTTFDAVGNILREHYKVLNVMFHFHKVAQVHYLDDMNILFMCVCKNVLPVYSSAKIIKIKRVFPEL